MPDQANELRHLVQQSAAPQHRGCAPRPRLVVVAGGKGGVGTTTVALGLTAALTRGGKRTVLVDAAGGDVAELCDLDPRHTLADVLAGRRAAVDALSTGPDKIQVLAGSRQPRLDEHSPAAVQRLLVQLADLGPRADMIIVDAGNSPDRSTRLFWQTADQVLLVASPETSTIMGAYSAVKLHAVAARAARLGLLVNFARADVAEEVYRRLARACRRFLAIEPDDAGWMPAVAAEGGPLALAAPGGAGGRHLGLAAQWVSRAMPRRMPEAA